MSEFAILCIAVCLSAAALSIVAGVVAVHLSWMCLCRIGLQRCLQRHPDLLFFIRTLPLSVPASLVLFAVLPSFLIMEPRETTEKPEWLLLGLAAFSLMGVGVFALKFAGTFRDTRRAQREWMQSARRLDSPAAIPIYELQNPDSLVAVVGTVSPRIFIGKRILSSLTPEELQAAVAHEIAHVHSLDNLRQTLLRASRIFSLFAPIDRAFRSAAEISADERAVQSLISPLDLGSAIVKVARFKAPLPSISASHLVPESQGAALQLRINHLQALLNEETNPSGAGKYGWIVASMLVIVYLAKLQFWLLLAHKFTEVLVR